MATINAPSLADTQYSGDCPIDYAHGYVTLAAQPAGDEVRLVKLFAGTKVYNSSIVNAALGAGVQVALGYRYVNGEAGSNTTAFIPASAANAAGKIHSNAAPVMLEYDAFIVATISGGAATGKLDAVIEFAFKGTK